MIRSGRFAGYRSGDVLYNADGRNAGYFSGDKAYSLSGQYLGELYGSDYIGRRTGVAHAMAGSRAAHVGTAMARHANRVGHAIAGWDDPNL